MHTRNAAAAVIAFTLLTLTTTAATAAGPPPYQGSRFADVWAQVSSDPYTQMPQEKVTVSSFFGFFVDHLLAASRRTLADKRDLLPWFRKLVHPNGICFAGTWTITEDNPFSGYFAKGSQGLIIVRASTALSETKRGEYRVFGFAGKLFPTLDPNAVVPTANFFTIEDLGGTLRDYYLDAENTNDIILVSPTPNAVRYAPEGAVVEADFMIADGTLDPTQPALRQLYPVSQIGAPSTGAIATPTWMMITGSDDVPRIVADDFRQELRIANYPDGLRFDILVSDWGTRLGPKIWMKIGQIEVYEDALTESCDHRLHFTHPPFKH
jgi:hypothetical protein